jgi:hypothetical protein
VATNKKRVRRPNPHTSENEGRTNRRGHGCIMTKQIVEQSNESNAIGTERIEDGIQNFIPF